jgi:hypothetical protein
MRSSDDQPAHTGRLSALLRLVPFARPYRGLIALSFAGALLASLAQIAVPLIVAAVVDGPLADGDKAGLVPLIALALVFGVAEAALFFLRRWAMNKSSLQLERDLRDTLYARLQRLPVSFHDRWASGQLLSRAFTDVGTIRRFIGFVAVFLAVNLLMCAVVLVLLLVTYWPLGLGVALTTVPLTVVGTKIDQSKSSRLELLVTDLAGNETACDPVFTEVVRETGRPERHVYTGIPAAERFVTVLNGDPGLGALAVEVNGRKFQMTGLRPGEERTLDVGSAVSSGETSTVALTAHGKPGGSAVVMIWDGL